MIGIKHTTFVKESLYSNIKKKIIRIAGTSLEPKYRFKFKINFKFELMNKFRIGQSAAKTKILFKTRLCKVQRLSRLVSTLK